MIMRVGTGICGSVVAARGSKIPMDCYQELYKADLQVQNKVYLQVQRWKTHKTKMATAFFRRWKPTDLFPSPSNHHTDKRLHVTLIAGP